jgi:hypothetical protein
MDNDLTSCFLGDKLLHLSTQNITEVVAEDSKSKPKYFVVDAGGKIEISYQKTEDLAELNRDVPPTWLYRWTRTITQNGIKTVGSILAPKCT